MDVVTTEIGVRDKAIFRTVVVFEREIDHRRNGILDITCGGEFPPDHIAVLFI